MARFNFGELFGLCFWIALVSPSHQDRAINQPEIEELKSMLRESLHHNKRMERQMGRLKLVWEGLEQLCQTVNNVTSGDSSYAPGGNFKNNVTKNEQGAVDDVTLIEVSSSGKVENAVNLTISFQAPRNVTTYWRILYDGNQFIIVGGTLSSKGYQHENEIQINNISDVNYIIFGVTADTHTLTEVAIEPRTLLEPVREKINMSSMVDVNIHGSYQANVGEDLVIDLPPTIGGKLINHTGPLHSLSADFVYINTSSDSSSFVTIRGGASSVLENGISILGPSGGGNDESGERNRGVKVKLSLDKLYSQFGGILTIYMHSQVGMGLISNFRTTRASLILMPDTDRPFPENSIGVQAQDTADISPEHGFIYCAAIGYPAPNITMMKVSNKGRPPRTGDVVTHTIAHRTTVIRNFINKKPSEVKGTYICRMTNGNETIETTTTVDVFLRAKIDEKKTRLKKNTSEEIVVVCKATGSPRPHLSFVNDQPADLTQAATEKVIRKESGKYASRLTLTIPTEDLKYPSVTCIADQERVARPTRHRIIINENIQPPDMGNFTYDYY